MAESKNNDASFGLSGRFGKMFSFRQWFGKTLAARRPGSREGKPGTPNQEAAKLRFKDAAIYGNGIISNEDSKKLYSDLAPKGVNPYARAVGDYLKRPQITGIEAGSYKGLVNDVIKVRAEDDFKVLNVTVSISAANGDLLEQGDAILTGNKADWDYTAKTVNPLLPGTKILATAYDLPGNWTKMEITL